MEAETSPETSARQVLSRLLVQEDLKSTVAEIRAANILLPEPPIGTDISVDSRRNPWDSPLLERLEDGSIYELDAAVGARVARAHGSICAYDESIRKYAALEGTAYLVCHTLVTLASDQYQPLNLLTFRFYTRAEDVARGARFIRFSENPTTTSEQDYMDDKIGFLTSYVPKGSLLFVDGPLIAGDAYVRMIAAMERFHALNVLPIFFVKNSESDLVIENTPGLGSRYNSDLHWANKTLSPGARSALFKYSDRNNPRNSKVFCYLRALNVGPQRVEFHSSSYEKSSELCRQALDLAYYFLLVQGSKSNPQVRPVAIAEQYARETLRLINLNQLAAEAGLSPTMNQERFGW